MVSIDLIKQLREETGISVGECKKALEQAKGDMAKAKELLRAWGKEVASRKQKREAKEGLVEAYVHATGKIGAMVQVRCETDFVSRSADFKNLCHELALQVVSMDPEDVSSLLDQQYVRDTS
ncbi:MAG: elongation factor Ts, partial [Parcubacteria group bacterium]|nr:elongation factor Ts [Parcubacteria group bacterium]